LILQQDGIPCLFEYRTGEVRVLKYGAALKACRDRIGMSQEQLADKLKLSRSTVSKLENDQQELSVRTLSEWVEVTNAKEVLVAFICGMDGLSFLNQIMPFLGG
jgi:transcriptional regulator with XRE-family HTH domain